MSEYAFELALCAELEGTGDGLVGRQIGGGVTDPGRRIVDVVLVEPGPAFERRTTITAEAIPSKVIEAAVGPGRFRYWKRAVEPLEGHPKHAERCIDRGIDIGFLESRRQNGRRYVRQTTRYPDWFETLTAIENKPDLAAPGELETQLRHDVSLGVFDAVILATASHVTGAHRNRIPDAVGIWRVDPTGDIEVLREPARLPVDAPGVEIGERQPGSIDIDIVDPARKRSARRRIAERVYGGGWRPQTVAACGEMHVDGEGIPRCAYKGRIVRPSACGPDCPGHDPAEKPDYDSEAHRNRRSGWVAAPEGCVTEQSRLESFEGL